MISLVFTSWHIILAYHRRNPRSSLRVNVTSLSRQKMTAIHGCDFIYPKCLRVLYRDSNKGVPKVVVINSISACDNMHTYVFRFVENVCRYKGTSRYSMCYCTYVKFCWRVFRKALCFVGTTYARYIRMDEWSSSSEKIFSHVPSVATGVSAALFDAFSLSSIYVEYLYLRIRIL